MITIQIPPKHKPEIQYTFHCLFKEFLGIEYSVASLTKGKDYVIKNENNNFKLTIKNHFFTSSKQEGEYNLEDLPKKVSSGSIQLENQDFPIASLYGQAKFEKIDQSWILHADIVASTFFMLSRWEETIVPNRDEYLRFPAKASLAGKEKFLERPVVNEYVELLWALLQKIGFQGKRKHRVYQIVPTHDVDSPYLWWNAWNKIRYFGGALVRGRIRESLSNCRKLILGVDPYDTHDYLMDCAEDANTKAHFFFMSGGNSEYDNRYRIDHPRIIQLIKHINDRGHHIGFHPSYNAYRDVKMFGNEKEALEQVLGETITTGRQHFLRFEVDATWRIWEEYNMQWDSTASYADQAGFRCGVCYPFPVFSVTERRMLDLYERPLILMEQSIFQYEGLNKKKAIEKIESLKSSIQKYNGEFVFLWHNSSFHVKPWRGREKIIQNLYK